MRLQILATLLVFSLIARGQGIHTISTICKQVSKPWKLDSVGCKQERLKLAELFLGAKHDSISKEFLFSNLGKPNMIQKYFQGFPVNKNFVEYIYFIYKDDCPKVKMDGRAIGFVFDESEQKFLKIEEHEYCE